MYKIVCARTIFLVAAFPVYSVKLERQITHKILINQIVSENHMWEIILEKFINQNHPCTCDWKKSNRDDLEYSFPEEEIRCIFDDNWKIIFVKSS